LIFSILFAFPYLENLRVIIIILIIFATHTIIDKIKLDYSKKNANQDIKIFLLDQFLHISIIAALSFNFKKIYLLISPFDNAFLNYLIQLYNNDIFIISLIGYIATIFFIPVLLIFIKEEDISYEPEKLNKQKITLSAQYLDDKYIIIIFICFVITSLIPYQISAERIEKVYNLKRIINTSLAIFIGIALKMI
jgi:hypothetical protein